jgi:DNA-directed RNA polymerase specialized sigma24 family protein
MYLFDLDRFNSDRRFGEHTQQFAISELEDDDEATSPLYEKFSDVLTVSIERSGEHSRSGGLMRLIDADLATKLRKLSVDDRKLLTLIVQDGYTVFEIASFCMVAHSTISRKLSRLKKYLKNFSANGTD